MTFSTSGYFFGIFPEQSIFRGHIIILLFFPIFLFFLFFLFSHQPQPTPLHVGPVTSPSHPHHHHTLSPFFLFFFSFPFFSFILFFFFFFSSKRGPAPNRPLPCRRPLSSGAAPAWAIRRRRLAGGLGRGQGASWPPVRGCGGGSSPLLLLFGVAEPPLACAGGKRRRTLPPLSGRPAAARAQPGQGLWPGLCWREGAAAPSLFSPWGGRRPPQLWRPAGDPPAAGGQVRPGGSSPLRVCERGATAPLLPVSLSLCNSFPSLSAFLFSLSPCVFPLSLPAFLSLTLTPESLSPLDSLFLSPEPSLSYPLTLSHDSLFHLPTLFLSLFLCVSLSPRFSPRVFSVGTI